MAVEGLGPKLDLAFEHHDSIKTIQQLAASVHISVDYLQRFYRGQRTPPDATLKTIGEALGVPADLWKLDTAAFARRIGSTPTKQPGDEALATFDFRARIRDSAHIRQLYELIGGYWESYYYSVSVSTRLVASRDLIFIGEPDDNGMLSCTVEDKHFVYRGWCFPIQYHLYMFLEKERIFNEIIVYMLNRPDRYPPRLEGLILCKSDGEDPFSSVPSAARIALRYLGSEQELLTARGVASSEELHSLLVSEVAGYVARDDVSPEVQREVFDRIRNDVAPDELPNALQLGPRTNRHATE